MNPYEKCLSKQCKRVTPLQKKKNAETLYVFGCPALGVTHITQQLAERKIGEI